MIAKKKVGLLALALASVALSGAVAATQVDSTMTVDATLVTACTVTGTSAINFGSFNALLSTGDRTANTGSSLKVACSSSASPTIFSSGTRSMSDGGIPSLLPFNLSLTAGAAANDLPSTAGTASTFALTQDGDVHDVVIYGRTLASNFAPLPSGTYSTTVTVSVVY